MRGVFTLLFLLTSYCLFCQDENPASCDTRELCKPGVPGRPKGKGLAFEYGRFHDLQYKLKNISNKNNYSSGEAKYFKVKVKIPIIIRSDLKVVGGIDHTFTNYSFNTIGQELEPVFSSLDKRALKSTSFSIGGVKPLDHRYYLVAKAKASFHGNYKNAISFNNRFSRYSAGLVLGRKLNENTEFGIGAGVRYNLDGVSAAPFAYFNKTFNESWGIETVLPVKLKVRHNISFRNLVEATIELKGGSFVFDVEEQNNSYLLRSRRLDLSLSFDQQVYKFMWIRFKSGYRHMLDSSMGEAYQFDATEQSLKARHSTYFNVTIFFSPSEEDLEAIVNRKKKKKEKNKIEF